jgi:bifunctional ADP-heptose synthase (sugar kinase/adenylyltransferase)
MALCCNASIWEASYIGSIAAAIQVSRVGNIPLQLEELINELKK